MTNITTHKQLQEAIRQLESKSSLQEEELRERFERVFTSVTPVNILKTAFHHLTSLPELKNSAINTAIGLGTGILTKKLYVGKSVNMFKKMAGTVIEFAVANFVRKKAPAIREKIAELAEKNKQ
jgi:hypothetical protein